MRIGDFARLSQVSVKTLRYYDEIGLLRAAWVDRYTGYRYYSLNQLSRLHRILALKDLGFSLEQVARLLCDTLPPGEIRGMLRMKQMELQDRLEMDQARLGRVEARLRQIEKENTMSSYEVVIKKVEPLTVAGVRDVIPTYSGVGQLFREVEGWLAEHKIRPTGPCIAIYYDLEYRERDVDAEAAVPVVGAVPGSDRVKLHQLPGVAQMASVLHEGEYDGLKLAYDALIAWIEASGYRIVGPDREIYLRGATDSGLHYGDAHLVADPAEFLTECQFPVEKA